MTPAIFTAFSFVAAFCAILYELSLAQTLTSLLGGTALRYSTTIGLYLLSLGIGAFFADAPKFRKPIIVLLWAELLLSALAILGPPALFATDFLLRPDGPMVVLEAFCYFLVFLTGILVGVELPILMKLARTKGEYSLYPLSADYLGSFIGALLFPLVLLPNLGLFPIPLLCGFWNALLALALAFRFRKELRSSLWVLFSSFLAATSLLLFFRGNEAMDWFIETLYISGF